MNRFIKFFTTVMCIVVMTILAHTVVFADEVRLSLQPVTRDLPLGSQVRLEALYSGGDNIEFYEKSSNGDVLIKSCDLGEAVIYVALGENKREIYAVAKSGDSEIARSGVITIPKGYMTGEESVIYDIDFEEYSLEQNSDSNPRVSLKKGNDYVVSPDGNGFAGYLGSAENSIAIDETASDYIASGSNGKSLHLQSRGVSGAQTQFNAVYIEQTSGIVVFEADYYARCDGNAVVFQINSKMASNSSVWNPAFTLNGNVYKFNNKTYAVGAEPAWHRAKMIFDLDSDTIACLVDEQLVDVIPIGADILAINRVVFSLPTGSNAQMWIDNFKVYRTERLAQITSVENSGNRIIAVLDKNIPPELIEDVTVSFGKEKLTVNGYGYTDSDTRLGIDLFQKPYTAVPLDIKIKYVSGDEIAESGYTAVLPREVFDVTSVDIITEDGKVGAKAYLINDNDEDPKYATMVLVLLDENGTVMNVAVSGQKYIGREETEITVNPIETEAKYAEVFFIDDFINCVPVKKTVYRYEINN